jgi:uncharacterized lipoprotein YajG
MRLLFIVFISLLFANCRKDMGSISATDQQLATAYDSVVETSPPVQTAKYIQINSNVAGFMETLPANHIFTWHRRAGVKQRFNRP